MDDIKIEKIRKAMKLAVDKITKNVYNLSYFNAINYNKNATNLKKVVVSDEKLLSANQLAIYDSFSNTIIVDLMEITNNITEEQLALLLLHELVHMMSADRELNKIGYNDNGLPLVYNEACTQWLTLKLFYDNDDFEQDLVSNFIYPESVRELNILISNGINEDVIFSGFFEANINVSTMLMNNEQKSKWVDFVLKMSTSLEERVASFEMEQLQQKIADSKNKIQ